MCIPSGACAGHSRTCGNWVRATWNAFRSKSEGHLFLITDAMPCVGAGIDHFMLDGRRIEVRDRTCRTGGGVLAGSALVILLAGLAPITVREVRTMRLTAAPVEATAEAVAPGA